MFSAARVLPAALLLILAASAAATSQPPSHCDASPDGHEKESFDVSDGGVSLLQVGLQLKPQESNGKDGDQMLEDVTMGNQQKTGAQKAAMATKTVRGAPALPLHQVSSDEEGDQTLTSEGRPSDNAVPLTKFLAAEYPNARCLDGTQSGLYFRPAKKTSVSNRWLILLRSGGGCTDEEGCVNRSKSWQGSSDEFYSSYDFDRMLPLSSDPRNPFADWNLVLVPNCCGTTFTGTRTTATNETWGLYFSGHHNIVATIDYLSRTHGLNQSGSLLTFSGLSVGGIGVINNYEYVSAVLPKVTVLGAIIAGVFPEPGSRYESPDDFNVNSDIDLDGVKFMTKLWASYFNENCVAATSPSEWFRCYQLDFLYQHLQKPLFIAQALTDWKYLKGSRGLTSEHLSLKSAQDYINDFGRNTSRFFNKVVVRSRDGLFAPSCYMHEEFDFDRPLIDGSNAFSALYAWAVARSRNCSSTGEFISIDNCNSDLGFWPPCGSRCPEPHLEAYTTKWTHDDDVQ